MSTPNNTSDRTPVTHEDRIVIPITRGQFTIISHEDADLAEMKWCARKSRGHGFYAFRQKCKKNVDLHRTVLERKLGRSLEKGEFCDHVNGDKLDNRRDNLRVATHAQNQQNRGKYANNKSGYKGVSWSSAANKWVAMIRINNKQTYLGIFDDPKEAYDVYCEAALKYHGEFAKL